MLGYLIGTNGVEGSDGRRVEIYPRAGFGFTIFLFLLLVTASFVT
jgi:hypothetical protein